MNATHIDHIINSKAFPFTTRKIKMIETHISWVILTDEYVYKIKKPVQFSFLDFSTLEKRKYYCYEELRLNRRLASQMYIDVLPIYRGNDVPRIGIGDGPIIDYALLMHRMDESRQMDLLLKKHQVSKNDIFNIAIKLVEFHKSAEVIEEGEDWKVLFEEFADIQQINTFVTEEIGLKASILLGNSVRIAYDFLKQAHYRIKERNDRGYIIDAHGDLHAKNIFLLERPVIFDCIEFNADLRQIDILSEMAFLCMDLERFGEKGLADYLFNEYFTMNPVIEITTDEWIFLFYQLHRTNVLMKVNAIKAVNCKTTEEKQSCMRDFHSYFRLFKRYLHKLENI